MLVSVVHCVKKYEFTQYSLFLEDNSSLLISLGKMNPWADRQSELSLCDLSRGNHLIKIDCTQLPITTLKRLNAQYLPQCVKWLACWCEQLKLMILSNYYVAAALVVFIQCFMVHSIINASYVWETGYSVCNEIILLYVSKLGSSCNA